MAKKRTDLGAMAPDLPFFPLAAVRGKADNGLLVFHAPLPSEEGDSNGTDADGIVAIAGD
ncbi:MAG: hypothetical protein FWE88_02915 [Phycisphaerae bacterium]|nr:hypothetical protein [Phycisphaerae bacterium]